MNNSQQTSEIIVNDKLTITNKRAYLCVVMPAYNEGKRIRDNLLYTSETISGFIKNYQIIAVNDGSSDDTKAGIIEAAVLDPHVAYISYSPNKGKGHAICTGVKYADAEYIAFLDSDMELDPSMLRYFLKALHATDADIAIGSKMHRDSKLDYPLSRKIISTGYYLILKLLFKLNLKDTQTGIKLFKGNVIKSICENLSTNGFAFDIEILATASKMGCKILELPITLKYSRHGKEKSKVSLKQIFCVFRDTIRIKKALREKDI
ncbi:MAG: glycosyltransferase family 2 protein [Wujia sp.]